MKPFTAIAGAALLLVASGSANLSVAAPAPKVCLILQEIQRTETPDDRTIIFHMRDGKTWRNTLKAACPMLKLSPWTEVTHSDLVCSNQQMIHVALTGDTCALGDFTPVPPPEH